MKHLFLSFTLIISMCISSSCSSDISEDTGLGSIAGSVSDATTGEPVPTVNVMLLPGGNSTVTGFDGSFSFQNLEVGNYTLQISKEGYSPNTKSLYVHSGEATAAHLLIERLPASITADKTTLEFGDQVQTLSFTIVNRSYTDLEYSIETGNCDWLAVEPDKGSLKYGKTETIVVNLLRDHLPMGRNEAMLVVRSLSGDGNVEIKVIAINGNATATLNTLETTGITSSSAVLNGEIVNIGEPKYSERGFVYSTNSNPTVTDCIQKLSCPVNDNPNFSCKIENLATLKTYYVRAYLVQEGEIIYGNTLSFSTSQQATEVTTSAASNVGATTATLHGTVTKAGVPAFTERGFCFSRYNSIPDISDNKQAVAGTGTGNYSLELTTLEYPFTYYARAYAIQGGGVVYGNVISFSTAGQKTVVSTSAATGVTATTATLNGSIIKAGVPGFTEKGFCFSKFNSTPTVSDNKKTVSGTSEGNYSLNLTNLEYPNTYYARAYAIQAGIAEYGNVISFSTSGQNPILSTSAVTDIYASNATFNATVQDEGNPAYTERGFCYTRYGRPTISDNRIRVSGSGRGAYSTQVTNLDYPADYSVCAYVIQAGEPVYGNVVTFSTQTRDATVNTSSVTDITTYSATFNGIITDLGIPAATRRGFCYSAYTSSPTISDSHLDEYLVNTANFKKKVDNLNSGTTYYVRAYAFQNDRYVYGNTVSFTTNSEPSVRTDNPTNVTADESFWGIFWNATFNGTVLSVGSPAYGTKGFVYGTSINPTVGTGTVVTVSGSGTGKFSSSVANLSNMQTYYVRAFVKVGNTYYYGENKSFSTY